MTQRRALALVVACAALPRLAALLYERGAIMREFTEKSDDFARTFVDTGTYGFIPGEPSAWTQPLYSFFLIPVYWVFGREWWAVGVLQIALAVATAVLVYLIGRRLAGTAAGAAAAAVATLNPYLVWHDVHVNREILDQVLAAAFVLLTLALAQRRSTPLAIGLGAALGAAILGNTRLLFVPLLVVAYLVWHARAWRESAVVAGACVVLLVPWMVRNDVEVGCFALTTDTKALWKANNEHTYETLARGGWIDDVPDYPGQPPTPEQAYGIYLSQGRVVHVDECAQMRFYRGEALEFWVEQPGEKAKLAGQAARMLWDPRSTRTSGGPGSGGARDELRKWVQPLHSLPLFVLGAIGLFRLPRHAAVLFVGLLAYQTLVAMAFAGATRYRVPWDFLLAVPAAAAAVWLWKRGRR